MYKTSTSCTLWLFIVLASSNPCIIFLMYTFLFCFPLDFGFSLFVNLFFFLLVLHPNCIFFHHSQQLTRRGSPLYFRCTVYDNVLIQMSAKFIRFIHLPQLYLAFSAVFLSILFYPHKYFVWIVRFVCQNHNKVKTKSIAETFFAFPNHWHVVEY